MFQVPVAGAPPPETVWLKDGEEVKSTDLIKVSHAPNLAKLLFIPSKREMRGKYTLKAKNKHGEDEAEIEITVIPPEIEDVFDNVRPTITSTPALAGQVGDLYRYHVTATDPNNDPLEFDLPSAPAGMAIDAVSGIIGWRPTASQVGTHSVVVRVRDEEIVLSATHALVETELRTGDLVRYDRKSLAVFTSSGCFNGSV